MDLVAPLSTLARAAVKEEGDRMESAEEINEGLDGAMREMRRNRC